MKRNRKAFTLVEILVVLAIIALLAAILLPVLNTARESSKQGYCAANLKQIYTAVKLYYDDNKAYPGSFAFLLPNNVELNDSSASGTPATIVNSNGGGYLKTSEKYLMCPDDDTTSEQPRSSYGDVSNGLFSTSGPVGPAEKDDLGRYVWNAYGYTPEGISINPMDDAVANPVTGSYIQTFQNDARFLYDPSKPYDATNNPVDPRKLPRLSNRYAPAYTIITHCVYHRIPTANSLGNPDDLYKNADDDKNAKDLILRLDGTVDNVDVSSYKDNVRKPWVTQMK